jgi:hypothetical protein
MASNPDPRTGGRSARCGAARKDLDKDHAPAAAWIRPLPLGEDRPKPPVPPCGVEWSALKNPPGAGAAVTNTGVQKEE